MVVGVLALASDFCNTRLVLCCTGVMRRPQNKKYVKKSNTGQYSESRKGNSYDNALMKSFYKTIKRELVDDAHFDSPQQAKQEIFKYIETYYNTKHMHSSPGYISPVQFEMLNS